MCTNEGFTSLIELHLIYIKIKNVVVVTWHCENVLSPVEMCQNNFISQQLRDLSDPFLRLWLWEIEGGGHHEYYILFSAGRHPLQASSWMFNNARLFGSLHNVRYRGFMEMSKQGQPNGLFHVRGGNLLWIITLSNYNEYVWLVRKQGR